MIAVAIAAAPGPGISFILDRISTPPGTDQLDAWSEGAKRLLTVKEKPARKFVPERIYGGEGSWMV